MDGRRNITLNEVSQKKRKKITILISLICGTRNVITNEPIWKTETDSLTENKLVVTSGEGKQDKDRQK